MKERNDGSSEQRRLLIFSSHMRRDGAPRRSHGPVMASNETHGQTSAEAPKVSFADIQMSQAARTRNRGETVASKRQKDDDDLVAGNTPDGWVRGLEAAGRGYIREPFTTQNEDTRVRFSPNTDRRMIPPLSDEPRREISIVRPHEAEEGKRYASAEPVPLHIQDANHEHHWLSFFFQEAGVPDEVRAGLTLRKLKDDSVLLEVPHIGDRLSDVIADWVRGGMPKDLDKMPIHPADLNDLYGRFRQRERLLSFDPETTAYNEDLDHPLVPTALARKNFEDEKTTPTSTLIQKWVKVYAQLETPYDQLPAEIRFQTSESGWLYECKIAKMQGISQALDATASGLSDIETVKQNLGINSMRINNYQTSDGLRYQVSVIGMRDGMYQICTDPQAALVIYDGLQARHDGVTITETDGKTVIYVDPTDEFSLTVTGEAPEKDFRPIPRVLETKNSRFDAREFAAVQLLEAALTRLDMRVGQDFIMNGTPDELEILEREKLGRLEEQRREVRAKTEDLRLSSLRAGVFTIFPDIVPGGRPLTHHLQIMQRRALRSEAMIIRNGAHLRGERITLADAKNRAFQNWVQRFSPDRTMEQNLTLARTIVNGWDWEE